MLRASLATLAALSVLGGITAVARRGGGPRIERVGLLLHHGVALGVAVAAALGAMLGGGDGRPLLLCAAGPLLVLCLQEVVSARLALLSVPPVVVGLVMQGLALLGVVPPALAGPTAAGLAAGATLAGAVTCLWRRRELVVPRLRVLLASQASALAVASFGAAVGILPAGMNGGLWAVAAGAAGALGTAGRLSPTSPPGLREVVGGVVVALLALVVGVALPLDVASTLRLALWAGLASTAAFALVSVLIDARPSALLLRGDTTTNASLPSPAALGVMPPLYDDALLRRPGRPSVVARVPARRLLEAALERARAAQPVTRGRKDEQLRVEVVTADADLDVDGDPTDLAEALCAVLDNALRVRAFNPEAKVQVHLRGGPSAITFEVVDSLPEGASPAQDAGIPDAEAPFLHPRADLDRPGLGVSLARARLLVEKNGGKLLTRSSAEGSTVQLTMPRRMTKGTVGQA